MLIDKAILSVLILAIPVCSEAGWLKKRWREIEHAATDAADAVVTVAHDSHCRSPSHAGTPVPFLDSL